MEDREFAARRREYRELMRARDLHGLLVTRIEDVAYLCGFRGSNGACLLVDKRGWFFTDSRYREQSAKEVRGLKAVVYGSSLEQALAEAIEGRNGLRLGFDPTAISYAGITALRRKLRGVARLIPLKSSLTTLRARKSRSELAIIRRAISLAEEAFTKALEEAAGDGTENGLAASIDVTARLMGAEGPAFETIVAGGKRGALVHARPSRRRLKGATVIDWGVVHEGYCTDATRTVAFGNVPRRLVEVHRLVLHAQEMAMEMIRPGVRARDVDRAAREIIDDEGYGDAFGHGLGHGVGLEVHERPYVGKNSVDVLEAGMVLTIEPGIYLPGVGGVRVEDMVLVTRTGSEFMTTLPRGLDAHDYL